MFGLDPHILEILMLFCFGSSWPFAIAKTIRTKAVGGKSIAFIIMVVIGYLAGIISKLTGDLDGVIWLYALNGSMVFTEMVLYFRYSRSNPRRFVQVVTPGWHPADHACHCYGFEEPTA